MNAAPAPIVALSISDGPDLARFGYLERHLRQVLAEVLVALLRDGFRLGYGGDLRRAGYTWELFEALAAAYARSRLKEGVRPAIVHYFPFSSWAQDEPANLVKHVEDIRMTAETRFCDAAGDYLAVFATDDGIRIVDDTISGTRALDPDVLVGHLAATRARGGASAADALSPMRRTMAGEAVVRVVASGKVVGYQGRMPGIVEEAMLHAAAGRLVVALGAFGGAARDVAIALGLLPPDARVRYVETGASYYPAIADLCGLAETHRHVAEKAGVWRDMHVLADADDPTVIAAGVRRIAGTAMSTDRPV